VVREPELMPPVPHPVKLAIAATIKRAASIEMRFRDRRISRRSRGKEATGRPARNAVCALVVTGAVVPIVTSTVWGAVPLSCTEALERAQVGAGDATGAIAQPSATVLENEAAGASDRTNFALWPALTD
jgi:hypothetical protein